MRDHRENTHGYYGALGTKGTAQHFSPPATDEYQGSLHQHQGNEPPLHESTQVVEVISQLADSSHGVNVVHPPGRPGDHHLH